MAVIAIKSFNPELVPTGAVLKHAAAVEFVKPDAQSWQKMFVAIYKKKSVDKGQQIEARSKLNG